MKALASCLAAAALALCGCSATRITASWVDSSIAGQRYHKVMVLGITEESGARRIFEDEFARMLKEAGAQGVASYLHLPADGKREQREIDAAVRVAGADAILTTRVVRVDKETVVTPPAPIHGPVPYYYSFYPYYLAAWPIAYHPGRISTYDVVTLESNLYDAGSGKLVWSARSEAIPSPEIDQESRALARLLIEDLAARGLLPAQRK